MRKSILSILILVSMIYADTSCYGLAIPSAFQNPEAKKKILVALEAAKSLKSEKEHKAPPRASSPKPKIQAPDRTIRLAELFKEEKFEGSVLGEAAAIIAIILEEEHISIPYETKVKLALVMRELALRPQIKAEDIAKQSNIGKDGLIAIYHLIRDTKPLQDILAKDVKYPGLVYLTKELLTNSGRLKDILDGKMVYPTIVEWHPGERCNSNCVFCYSRGKNYKDRDKGRKPLTLERVKELIHEFKANGVKQMWFSGGKEPFTNPITPKAIKEAVNVGLEVVVYSNGILFGEEARESVLGAKQVRISINAATPETYTKVHGINGKSFERATSNLRELTKLKKERGGRVRVGTSFLITPYSHNEIIKGAENAYKMGCDFFALRAEMIGTIRRFTEEEIQEILRQVEAIRKNKENGLYGNMELDIRSLSYQDLAGESHFFPEMKRSETCHVRAFKIGMNPYGIVYPCEYAEHPRNQNELLEIGNAAKESFYDIMVKSSQFKHDVSMCESCIQHEFAVNAILDKLKDDMDYGIALIDQPFASKPMGLNASFDVEITSFLSAEVINANIWEDRTYDIKYDASRLSSSQIDVIKEYVKLLQSRSPHPDNIRLKPFSSAQGAKESLIAVYCSGKDFKGEGHVDVSISEGELKDYLLRITGMLNMAIASASIPDNLSKEDIEKYRSLMAYIKNQYKSILGEELAIPDNPEDILKVIRRIVLGLPKSMRMNLDEVEEYNRQARETLIAA